MKTEARKKKKIEVAIIRSVASLLDRVLRKVLEFYYGNSWSFEASDLASGLCGTFVSLYYWTLYVQLLAPYSFM